MFKTVCELATVGVLMLAGMASAHGLRGYREARSYYVAPVGGAVMVAPAPVSAPVMLEPPVACPAPMAVAPAGVVATPYAAPSPAPPSTMPVVPPTTTPAIPTPASTSGQAAPQVRESRSFYQATSLSEDGLRASAAESRVGFWNLSQRDVMLRVEGQSYALPAGASMKLNVGRAFVWQVDGEAAQSETLAAGAPTMEIVIRR